MAFSSLIANLELGDAHILVASRLEKLQKCCIPILQSQLYFGDMLMHAVVHDFLTLGLCVADEKDPLFIEINYPGIQAKLKQFPPSLTVTKLQEALVRPTI